MDAEGLRALIAAGEGAHVEFKSSLRYDVQTGVLNRALAKEAAKALAGMLNAGGGMLLIGVSDDGSILGIQPDIELLTKKKNVDGFELTLRTILGNHLGLDVTPHITVAFVDIDGHTVACVSCEPHMTPVFFQDAERRQFYVRDGNHTPPLDVRAAYDYMAVHWPTEEPLSREAVQDAVREVLREQLGVAPPIPKRQESLPPWIRVATRQVVDLFLSRLAGSHGWKKIYVISPWISEFDASAALSFDQLLKRIQADRTTAYIVTRPPTETWHAKALERLGHTGRANVAIVPDLHAKLYIASTSVGAFAMLGSANFTQQSLTNREIGILVNAYSDGKRVVSQLDREAALIYRMPGRKLIYKAAF